MNALLRTLSAPLGSLALMMLGCGLLSTFISVRLELEGYPPDIIGFLTSSFYLGALAGSYKSDRWIGRLGHIRSLLLVTLSLVVLILLQSLWFNPWYWALIRALSGYAVGALYVAIESWLLIASSKEQRGQALSLYLAILYGSLSVGQFFLDWVEPRSNTPFWIAATLGALSLIPLLRNQSAPALKQDPIPLNLRQIFQISPIGFIGGIIAGMLLATIYGLVPYYGIKIGLTTSQTSTLMASLIFGGLCLQWPIGRLADRTCRRKTLMLASFLTALFSLIIAPTGNTSYPLLLSLAWILGGVSFTLYPLSMGFATQKVSEEHLIAATGGFVLSWGIGAILGPVGAGYFMEWFGTGSLFAFLALISGSLGLLALRSKS